MVAHEKFVRPAEQTKTSKTETNDNDKTVTVQIDNELKLCVSNKIEFESDLRFSAIWVKDAKKYAFIYN